MANQKGTTMKYLLASTALIFAISTAQAGSKAEDSAAFRLKVATCKATAKADGVKSTTPDFYGYMGACLDRVTVAVNVAAK